jgi:hypothetical protein
VYTMKVTRFSALYRYTCAAVNGREALTVPVTAPVPGIVESAARLGAVVNPRTNTLATARYSRQNMACPPDVVDL